MVPAPVERSQLPGHRQRSQIPQHRQWWRSPSLAQRRGRCGSKDQRNLSPLTLFAALSRARGGRRFQRALTQTDLHRPAGRRCGCWPTSTFLFRGIVVGRFSGADDGARAIGADADVGFAGSGRQRWCRRRSSAASYRVIDNDRQIPQHRQWFLVALQKNGHL